MCALSSNTQSDDEVLLNRYLDGELEAPEKGRLEQRLREDERLRALLAEVVQIHAAVQTAIGPPAGVRPAPLAMGTRAAGSWTSRHWIQAAAVAVVVVTGIAARTWWVSPTQAAYRELGRVESQLDTTALRAGLDEILGSKPDVARRQEIYRSWQALDAATLEPFLWAVARTERDPRARTTLYLDLPTTGARDFDTLLETARAEWSENALEPLGQLIPQLRFHASPKTESFYLEVLRSRERLPERWIAERLATMQSAFPSSAVVVKQTTEAMNDSREVVQASAALARAAVGGREGVDRAVQLLRAQEPDARKIAVATIKRHGLLTDIRRLECVLDDPEVKIRNAARAAFSEHGLPLPDSLKNP
jgi:hypothetical protein